MTMFVDSLWTTTAQTPVFATNSWITPYRFPDAPAKVGLARRGPRPKAVSRMQISGADYGPAVPSGVSLCPGPAHGIIARVSAPEPALPPDAIRGAREGVSPMYRDTPQYVHDGS